MKLKIKKKPEKKKRLSTGCTLLNLAISDDPLGGFEAGKFYYLVGDSTSGKTFFSMTCFAEACRNEHFKDYDRIYDNIEDGMLMDCDKLFGSEADLIFTPVFLDEFKIKAGRLLGCERIAVSRGCRKAIWIHFPCPILKRRIFSHDPLEAIGVD